MALMLLGPNWVGQNQGEVVKYLLGRDAELHVTDKKGDSVLFWAALYNNIDLLKKCLDDGQIDPNAKNSSGQTALHVASGFGNFEAVKLLLDHHAEIDTKDNQESTPLHNARRMANDESTPLHLAVAEFTGDPDLDFLNNAKCVEHLLDKGADINAPDVVGYTPLIFAVANSVYDCAEILISRGADMDAKTTNDYNVFHVASEAGQEQCLQILVDYVIGTDGGDGSEAEQHLEHRSLIDSTVKTKLTPLHCAILGGHLGCVQILCDAGANVEAQSISGKTPLQRATEKKHVDIMKYLLALHADVNKANNTGITALHIAASNGLAEPLGTLLEYHADVNAQLCDHRHAYRDMRDKNRDPSVSSSQARLGAGKTTTVSGHLPPGQLPPDNNPSDNHPLGQVPPGKIPPHNYPLG
eukprot:XP_011680212.1 PREDICTED: transient receptor potential channel pyrexia-like [Strongylocentrotus purpuratus]